MRRRAPPHSPAPPRRVQLKFITETFTELRKVVWPTRQETLRLTLMVLWVAVAVGLFLGAVDYGLTLVAKLLFSP